MHYTARGLRDRFGWVFLFHQRGAAVVYSSSWLSVARAQSHAVHFSTSRLFAVIQSASAVIT